MPQRKRVSAARRTAPGGDEAGATLQDPATCQVTRKDEETCEEGGSSVGTGTILPFLSHVTAGCHVGDVTPSACIPLYLMRNKNSNAVATLKAIVNGDSHVHDRMLTGMVSGSPTSIIVPLQGELTSALDQYLEKQCDSIDDARAMKDRQDCWYGVVDGCQLHGAIMELMSELPSKWAAFKWKVIVLRGNCSFSECRQLARVQNERSKGGYTYPTTVYDLLRGLKVEYDTLYEEALKQSRTGTRGVKVAHKDVATRYDGGNHSGSTSTKQAVSVASRLSWEAVEVLGNIVNMDCSDIVLQSPSFNKYSVASRSEVLSRQDCRLFNSFVCFGAMRASKRFISACGQGKHDAQVNCLHRMRHWSEMHGYKPVQPRTISEQFDLAVLALAEEQKFLDFITEDKWPQNMETVKENLLRTTLLDRELIGNSGNDSDLLPSLWKSFKRLYPGRSRAIEESANSGANNDEENNGENPDSGELNNPDPQPPPPVDDTSDKEAEAELAKIREEQRIITLQQSADSILKEVGIASYNMSFTEFAKETWSSGNCRRVDLVLTSLSAECREQDIAELPSFCRTVLSPGSYCFIIATESQFGLLQKHFTEQSFKVSSHSFKILYDPSTLQRRVTVDFPQRHGDIAFIAKSTGRHPANFQPKFDGEAEKFASATGVRSCQDKLKKPLQNAALFPAEKSSDLYSYIIRLLSPPQGTVMDPFAGPLTTALACLKTERRAVCIEHDSDSFPYALARLRIHAVPGATMSHMADYAKHLGGTTGSRPASSGSTAVEKGVEQGSPKRRRTEIEDTGCVPVADGTNVPSKDAEPTAAEALLMFRAS